MNSSFNDSNSIISERCISINSESDSNIQNVLIEKHIQDPFISEERQQIIKLNSLFQNFIQSLESALSNINVFI